SAPATASWPWSAASRIGPRTTPERTPLNRHESAEHDAEEEMPERRLPKGPAGAGHRRQFRRAAGWMEAVAEQRQRIRDEMLDQREGDGKPERVASEVLVESPEDEARHRAVDD